MRRREQARIIVRTIFTNALARVVGLSYQKEHAQQREPLRLMGPSYCHRHATGAVAGETILSSRSREVTKAIGKCCGTVNASQPPTSAKHASDDDRMICGKSLLSSRDESLESLSESPDAIEIADVQ